MKKTKLTRSLMAACSIVALSAVMYGCVHSGGDEEEEVPPVVVEPDPPPPPAVVDLMGSTDLMAGMTTIAAGASVTVGDTTLTCSDDADCVVTVMQDDVTGAYSATATGGTVTVAVAEPPPPPMEYDVALPDGHGLADGMTEIAAGETVMLPGGAEVTCDGAEACAVTVSTDGVTGVASASSTGGMVVVTTEATRMAAAKEEKRLQDIADMTTLSDAQDELARVQALYDAGDATKNELKAAQKVVADAMMLAGNQPPPPPPDPEPVVVAASGDVTGVTSAALQAAFEDVLEPGESDMLTIPAGGQEVREGVTFMCQSARDCTVTVTNNLGTIVATWMSYDVDDAAAMVVASVVTPPRVAMIVGGADRASPALVHGAIHDATPPASLIVTYTDFNETDVAAGATTRPTARVAADVNELKYPGTFELQGDFVEFQAEPVDDAADPDPIIPSTSTDMDGGPTLNAAGLALSGLASWRVHALERDWSHRLPDEPEDAPLYGGFETNALIAENIGANKTRQFDKLFTLNMDSELENLSGNPALNAGYAVFNYDGQSGTYQNKKEQSEDWRGSFAGVPGLYRCTVAVCWLVKDRKQGTVSVRGGATEPGEDFATLEFVPDDAMAMASVPDWTWQTFGAWMTTPNNDSGQHSIGLIATGGGLADTLADAEYYAVLEGEATYKGLALGYYADGIGTAPTAGTFTATATLSVDFDEAAANISGRISNFHDANGEAMDEFVVDLDAATLNATGGGAAATSGHANGVDWIGNWAAQLGGAPDDNVEGISFETTVGVAEAEIKALNGAGVETSAADHPLGATGTFDASNGASAVTGAFGADLQPPKEE